MEIDLNPKELALVIDAVAQLEQQAVDDQVRADAQTVINKLSEAHFSK